MVTLDIARSDEDFRKCRELLEKTHPNDPLPDFGLPGHTTFIVWDNEREQDKIRGLIHCEVRPEISHLAVDPDYKFQDASFALLHQFTEGNLRVGGHRSCYHTVGRERTRTLKMLRKSGAEVVNENEIRLRKEL